MVNIVIEVDGGVVQNVYADDDVDVTLVDWDNEISVKGRSGHDAATDFMDGIRENYARVF